MNNKEAVCPSDDNSNVEDHGTQHEWINQNNSLYTLVQNELQASPQLEDHNATNYWKTTNKHEGELVMAYNNNARSNIFYQKLFYSLYIRPNNNGIGHQRNRY